MNLLSKNLTLTNFYDTDLNTANLQTQLETLKVSLPSRISGDVKGIIKYVRNLTQVQRDSYQIFVPQLSDLDNSSNKCGQ